MTTVVMIHRGGDVVAGWDSMVTNGTHSVSSMTHDKVWVQGGVTYGFAGNLRTLDILQTTKFPEYTEGDARKWITTTWVPTLIESIKDNPFAFDKEEGVLKGVALLMVVGGRVFDVDDSMCPAECEDGVYAIGTGSDFARGALLSGATVMQALTIARDCDAFTGGTLTAKSVKQMIKDASIEEKAEADLRILRGKANGKKSKANTPTR